MKHLIFFLWLVILTGFLTLCTNAQRSVVGDFGPTIMSAGVWTRTGPLNSATGTYSYINDKSILAYGNDVWAGGNGDGMYMSRDGGQTWNNRSAGLPRDSQGNVSVYAKHLVGSFNPARPTRLYIGTVDVNHLYRSDDGGFNWKMVYRSGVPYVDSTTTSLFVADVPLAGPLGFPDQLWASVYGYSSGIYFSLDSGETWAPFDPSGLPTTQCQVVSGKEGDLTHDPDLVIAACRSSRVGVGSVYKSLAHNARWTSANIGLPANIEVTVISPSNKDGTRRIYLGLSNNFANGPVHIYRSDDNGDSWVGAAHGLPADADVRDIVVDVRKSNVAYAALRGNTGGVYKTIDAGQNWFLFSNGLTTSTAAGLALGIATTSSTDPAMVHLGTYNGVWSITDTNAGNCNVSLSDPVRSVPSWYDTYSVNITANSGCAWSAVSNANWIRLGTITSGTGSGGIAFTILQNTLTTPQTGTISIGNQTLTITQSGASACEYYIPIPTQNISSLGASSGSQFFLRTSSHGCSWAASSTAPGWITVTPPGIGTGDSNISYSVQQNPNTNPRKGTITVGGQSFTVNQFGTNSDPCLQKMPIVVGQILNGSLSTSDCQQGGFNGYRNYYSFRAIAGQRITVEMSAPSFFPALNMWLATSSPNVPPSYGTDHSIRYPVGQGYATLFEAGEYIIEARSSQGPPSDIGDYTIKIIDAESVCPPVPISPGTYQGSLSSSDCGNGLGQSSDIFTFYGTQGQRVAISASSTVMDMYLLLYNDVGVVANDDNGGGGTTARIPAGTGQFTLPTTGLYRIEVTVRKDPPKTGDYTLTFATTSRTRVKNGKTR